MSSKNLLFSPDAIYQRAALLYQSGQLEKAAKLYKDLIKRFPKRSEFLTDLGTIKLQLGNIEEGVKLLERSLEIAPDQAMAYSNCGIGLQYLNRFNKALACYDRALALDPNLAEAWSNRGFILHNLKLLDESLDSCDRAIALQPNLTQAHVNRSSTLKDLCRLEEALSSADRALALNSRLAEAHINRGAVLKKLNRFDEALACFDRAIALNPNLAEAHSNHGFALNKLSRFDDALVSFDRAIALNPNLAEAHNGRGGTLNELGRFEEAIAGFTRAIALQPSLADAYNNRGGVLNELGRFDEASASIRSALALKPDLADAHSNLGNALKALGRLDEAVACCRRALEINPDFVEAHCNLGNSLQDFGQLDQALACYSRALEIKPDLVEAHSNLLFTRNYLADQPAAILQAEARRFGDLAARKATPFTIWRNVPEPNRCLRVGLVSGDLCTHPVGYFIENVLAALEAHAVGRLELIAYSAHIYADALTERINACCHAWHSAVGLSDAQLAQQIRDDGIDILIDLSGHTAHNRLTMFAWKPAPVQTSWLGYFATTGVAAVDYLIADPWTLPETEEVNFTETIWRLPETRLCFTPPDANVDVSPLPALANGTITFGCFNNLTKMNDAVVALWARVLDAVPQSRLFLKSKQLGEASVRQNVLERFAAHGIGADRLMLEGSSPRLDYFSAYHRVDIALDPFPFPGGTVTVEALWMGVPVLTLAGERFVARQGVGLLMNADLPEWIAADADDYVARAVSHAGDLQRLAALRAGLRQQVLASPIFDAPRFARHLEVALRGMWAQWCDRINQGLD